MGDWFQDFLGYQNPEMLKFLMWNGMNSTYSWPSAPAVSPSQWKILSFGWLNGRMWNPQILIANCIFFKKGQKKKKSRCKWTHAVQIHVVQRSTAFIFSILFLADFYPFSSLCQVLGNEDHLISLCPLYPDPFLQVFTMSLFLYTTPAGYVISSETSPTSYLKQLFYFPHLSLLEIIQHVYF